MTTSKQNVRFLSFVMLVVALFSPLGVEAQTVVYQQLVSDTESVDFVISAQERFFPETALCDYESGYTFDSFTMMLNRASTPDPAVMEGEIKYGTSGNTVVTTATVNVTGETKAVYEFTFSPAVSIDTVCGSPTFTVDGEEVQFLIGVNRDSGGNIQAHGKNASSTNNSCYPTDGRCGDVLSNYLTISINPPDANATSTRIISQNNPTLEEIEPDTDVNFNFDYFYTSADTPNISVVGVQVKDNTNGTEYFPVENPILASGQSNFSENITLVAGNHHLWRPYMRNADSTEFIYGSWVTFHVESLTPLFSEWDLETGLPNATTTGFFPFLNVPNLLKTKIPFAYGFELYEILSDQSLADEGNVPTLTIAMPTTSPLNMSVTLLSPEAIDMFVPDNLLALFRTLILWSAWFGAGIGIYYQIKRLV